LELNARPVWPGFLFPPTKGATMVAITEEAPLTRANLLMHCGASAVKRKDLGGVATPRATRTWRPIPHIALVEQVEQAVQDNGLTVTGQAHSLTHDGGRYFGILEVRNGSVHPDYSWVLGLRNSSDKVLPAGLVAGSQVLVCDNLAFSGEIKIARKHTRFIMDDLPRLIRGAIERLVREFHHQDERISSYKQKVISDRAAHDLIIRATDAGALPIRRIPLVLNEWRKPRHQAFAPRNAWSLFNAATETLKGGNLNVLASRTEALHRLLDEAVGLHRLN
jgi:hypothetical protein